MGTMNLGRIVLGGLVAGLVINVGEYVFNTFLYAEQNADMLAKLGLPDINVHMIFALVLLMFVLGLVLIWLYAAIRARFGSGIKTALYAGAAIWVVIMIMNVQLAIIGIGAPGELVVPGIWSLFEIAIAAIVGAWLYQESAAAA
jgi:hypothetical protein